MVHFPYPRLALLFDALQGETLPQDELARMLEVSSRTVRTDIGLLNDILSGHGARFILRRGEGYQLQLDDPLRYHQMLASAQSNLSVPRSGADRIHYLLISFLSAAYSLKLQDLADNWYVNRATLQNDMAEVREHLSRYQLTIETRPYYGMKLLGDEAAIRTCLSDLLFQIYRNNPDHPLLGSDPLFCSNLADIRVALAGYIAESPLQMTDEAELFLAFYCAVALKRISTGFALSESISEAFDGDVQQIAQNIILFMQSRTANLISANEKIRLCIHIAARRMQIIQPSLINADDAVALVSYILEYINTHYGYDLRGEQRLCTDLATHIKTMITRIRYQITLPNPVLADIKEHYALAYDITFAALSSWAKHTPYTISEDEIGYVVLHIGVGLERQYQIGYLCRPQVLLVCDKGMSTARIIEAIIHRKFPKIVLIKTISQREYELIDELSADFVISTARINDKGKPIALISPFPSDYQLEQISKLVSVDRTRPYMLARFFHSQHFMRIDEPITQTMLFSRICAQLEKEKIVKDDFLPSVIERESILSTMLGDGIALPHSLGLLAKKTVVYTIIAPQGIDWGNGSTARLIFLLAISKEEYESAMAIYDLFIAFVRDRSTSKLLECQNFAEFKTMAAALT